MCVSLWAYATCMWGCLCGPEKYVSSPWAGVPGCYEPDVDVGNWIWVLWRNIKYSQTLGLLPSSKENEFIYFLFIHEYAVHKLYSYVVLKMFSI